MSDFCENCNPHSYHTTAIGEYLVDIWFTEIGYVKWLCVFGSQSMLSKNIRDIFCMDLQPAADPYNVVCKVSFIILRHCCTHWPCWLRTLGGASSLTKTLISQSALCTFASAFTLVKLALCVKGRRTLKGTLDNSKPHSWAQWKHTHADNRRKFHKRAMCMTNHSGVWCSAPNMHLIMICCQAR